MVSELLGDKMLAHVRFDSNGNMETPHYLIDHLLSTGNLSYEFSEKFHSGVFGRILGEFHDLGKGRIEWQNYFKRKTGIIDEVVKGKVEHSIYGAKYVKEMFPVFGEILAYGISGHHSGLPDWSSADGGQSSLKYRLSKNIDLKSVNKELLEKLHQFNTLNVPWKFEKEIDLSLWIRMLFSSLVDADFLDTEAYMDPGTAKIRGNTISLSTLMEKYDSYMKTKESSSKDTHLNKVRKSVRLCCLEMADRPSGIFSLTVPTGGGKTLSSLGFAMKHAIRNNQDRVIFVEPYTSIIEQNADVFREVLGDENVLEHHSNIERDRDTIKTKLASENWDARLIVTTSVQFFESLFASRPGRCRKLHNIANSVVVLDEAQMIPVNYLGPILKTLKLLVKKYKVSIVLSTATQPAFKKHEVEGKKFPGFEDIEEIMGDKVSDLFKELERVSIKLPDDLQTPVSWEKVSQDLLKYRQVLCIVSDRKSCRELFSIMPKGTYHLSALMCGEHRSRKIKEIKRKLETGETVRVISTQLIEAGVDLDFPVVYRSMAGLDSIAQAAGRCNREGLSKEQGLVFVFKAPRKTPSGILRKSEETLMEIISDIGSDIIGPESFERFFTELYWKANDLDINNVTEALSDGLNISFKTASRKFKMIDDSVQKTIIVRYDSNSEKLIEELKMNGPSRILMRKLQRYSVNIYDREFNDLLGKGYLEEISKDIFALSSKLNYSDDLGVVLDEVLYDPEKYILQ